MTLKRRTEIIEARERALDRAIAFEEKGETANAEIELRRAALWDKMLSFSDTFPLQTVPIRTA